MFLLFWVNAAFSQLPNSGEGYFAKYAQIEKNVIDGEPQNYIVIDADIKSLQQQGIVLLRPLAANAAIVYIDHSLKKYFLDSMHYIYSPASNVWKYSTQFERELLSPIQPKSLHASYIIVVKNVHAFIKQIVKNKLNVKIEHVETELNSIIINCSNLTLMNEIIPMMEVVFVDVNQNAQPEIMLSGYYKYINHIAASEYFYPNDNGQEITIGIKKTK
nr:hypothetical protein [Bacteroidota bacterium]